MRRLTISFVALITLLLSVPVLATHDSDNTISIETEGVLRGAHGEILEVITVPVEQHLIGATCTAGSVETQEGSTHQDNDYILSSGGTSAEIPNFEAAEGAVVPMEGTLVLGSSIKVEVRFGPGKVTSGGFLIRLTCAGAGSGRFLDDDNSPFEAAIEWLADQGITKGCNPPWNDFFCPDDFVTRGQMAAFLSRALDYTHDGGGGFFTDTVGHTFESAIDKLATADVTKGCNPPANTNYCPNDFVTRGQMAAFLSRALDYTDDGGGGFFTDTVGHTFESAIDKLATADVTKGCNPPANTNYCPNNFVTRGQMAAFLSRALG